MPVYLIIYAPGLTLKTVLAEKGCGGDVDQEQVHATYDGPDGDLVRLYQGTPYYCGNLGDVRGLGTARMRGQEAFFYESPNSDNRGGMFLRWYTAPPKERSRGLGSAMYLEVRGRDKARALRIARSLRLVR